MPETKTNTHPILKSLFQNIKTNGVFAGRLQHYIRNWKKITNDPSILGIVKGWEINFKETPFQRRKPQRINMNAEEKSLVSSEINGMLEKGAIQRVYPCEQQMLSNIFLKEKKNGSFRPIINLRRTNSFIPYQLNSNEISLQRLSSLIGKLLATAPAMTPARLQTRYLMMWHIQELRKPATYSTMTQLNDLSREELKWWIENLKINKGNSIQTRQPDIIIQTDAALTGWGAHCQGNKTGGPWTREESMLHINILELKAVYLALRTFTTMEKPSHIHFQIDNTCAIAYLLKMGGTKNQTMTKIAKEIWDYLLSNKITITAEYLPSKLNQVADWESRHVEDSTEWKIDPQVFLDLCSLRGTPEIDLFASRISNQLPQYMSLKQDPYSIATDAMQQDWCHKYMYAFPPFNMVGQVLRKTQKHQNQLLIITPIWVTQTWYPLLLQMSIDYPILIPPKENLLKNSRGENHPLLSNSTLELGAWLVSGRDWKQKEFQKELLNSCQLPDQMEQNPITNRPGRNLVAGVIRGRLIPFVPLYRKS